MVAGFTKITPINGFDANNPDNARQNNYAWSVAELGDYLYIGTGRNIFYLAVQGLNQRLGVNIQLPDELMPENIDMAAEIWRYKKDGSQGWQRVLKAPPNILGFRFMINYTTPQGETALYAGAFNLAPNIVIYKSRDGVNWTPLNTNIQGSSTRAMVIHQGVLYMGVMDDFSPQQQSYIYASTDPQGQGWSLVTGPGSTTNNPSGEITVLKSFNGYLYAGASGRGGFSLWRSKTSQPQQNNWKVVVDKGAGDAANEVILTLGEFKEHLYIGAIIFPPATELRPAALKPFDVIRVDKNDRWQLLIGSEPLEPTNPTTGVRGPALSGLPSGMGNPTNLYCWQLQEFEGQLYLGTFDWSVLLPPMIWSVIRSLVGRIGDIIPDNIEAWIQNQLTFIQGLLAFPRITSLFMGFDLYKSSDGIRWLPVTINGLGNPHNYGARNLYVSSEGKLYLGTANPFEGCEVWVKDNNVKDQRMVVTLPIGEGTKIKINI